MYPFKVLLELKGGRAPHHQFFRLRFDYSTTHRRRSNVKINTSFYGQRLLKDKCSKLVPLSNEENMSHRTLDTTAGSRIVTDHRNDT